MNAEFSEGTLATRIRTVRVIEPDVVWERAHGMRPPVSRITGVHVGQRHRLAVAIVAAILVTLVGGTAIAVTTLTRPAFVFGKPVTQSSGGNFPAHMGWPGHPIITSIDEASRLSGFQVLIVEPRAGIALNSVTYVPEVVPASEPAPMTGGSVTLDYTIDGTEVQLNEFLDLHPSAPLVINQKIGPGYTGPLCSSVETIQGGQYVFVRCPDGKAIASVFWKTLDGVDISLVPVMTSPSGQKGSQSNGLSIEVIQAVISGLR
ncbi:hypothetical protein EPN29_00895 [bacterium]|nr:MAG: hypothetical protein EPN29_00895 [bacterium]